MVSVSWRTLFGAPPWQGHASPTNVGTSIDVAMLVMAVLLILDSALCLWGVSVAFYVSALMAVVMLVFVPGGIQPAGLFLVSLLLAVATVGLDAIAARSRDYINERDHPLNLPVFG